MLSFEHKVAINKYLQESFWANDVIERLPSLGNAIIEEEVTVEQVQKYLDTLVVTTDMCL